MKKFFLTTKYFFTFYFSFSILTFAQNTAFNPDTFKPVGTLISSFTDNVVKGLMTMFGAAALTVFVYGIVLFIGNQANGGAKLEEGKKFMLWGLIALFVMISVWGIVLMFQSLIGINKNDNQVNIKPICISGVNCPNDSNKSTPANQAEGQPCRSERINGFYDSNGYCVPSANSGSGEVKSSSDISSKSSSANAASAPVLSSQTPNSSSTETSVSIPENCKQILAYAGRGATVSYSILISSYLVAGGNLSTPKKCGDTSSVSNSSQKINNSFDTQSSEKEITVQDMEDGVNLLLQNADRRYYFFQCGSRWVCPYRISIVDDKASKSLAISIRTGFAADMFALYPEDYTTVKLIFYARYDVHQQKDIEVLYKEVIKRISDF